MKSKDETIRRIVVTLERIKNVDETINKHRQFAAPNDFAISEWERMKQQLVKELIVLLAKSGVDLQAQKMA
jgi:hypothetical protein